MGKMLYRLKPNARRGKADQRLAKILYGKNERQNANKNAASYQTMRRLKVVDSKGIEPSTSRMRTERSPS